MTDSHLDRWSILPSTDVMRSAHDATWCWNESHTLDLSLTWAASAETDASDPSTADSRVEMRARSCLPYCSSWSVVKKIQRFN